MNIKPLIPELKPFQAIIITHAVFIGMLGVACLLGQIFLPNVVSFSGAVVIVLLLAVESFILFRPLSTKANDLFLEGQKFQLAIDNASDQILITDPDGIVIYANKAVEQVTGYSREEVIHKKAGILWHTPMPKPYYARLWKTIKKDKKVFVSEIQNRRKNGELYTANISISPILNKQNELRYFVGIEHDITHEKEVDRAKTEFVSLASHQLRSPLSTIGWYTEMLLAGDVGPVKDKQRKYLNRIFDGNQRMVALVNGLLNASRLELGTIVIEPEPTDVIAHLNTIIEEFKASLATKKLELVTTIPHRLPRITLDPNLFEIVIQNLLSNAIKYTPDKGRITLALDVRKKGDPVEDVRLNADALVFQIQDTGYGIPSYQQYKIFSKLFRADNVRDKEVEGTGLGLFIVKTIVDLVYGNVWFNSAEGEGTTFFVTIPLKGMKKKAGTTKLMSEVPALKQPTQYGWCPGPESNRHGLSAQGF